MRNYKPEMRVYVAGSSEELDRCDEMMKMLEGCGFIVTSKWTKEVRKVGLANPSHAPLDQHEEWAEACITGVEEADVFLMLMPQGFSHGAFFELGFSLCTRTYQEDAPHLVVAGGSPKRSIFTSLVDNTVAHDEEAIEYLCQYRRCWRDGEANP